MNCSILLIIITMMVIINIFNDLILVFFDIYTKKIILFKLKFYHFDTVIYPKFLCFKN
jgi:hypothetical protein